MSYTLDALMYTCVCVCVCARACVQWGVLEVSQIENMMKLTGSCMQLWVVNTTKVSNETMKMIKDVQCILLIMPSVNTRIY